MPFQNRRHLPSRSPIAQNIHLQTVLQLTPPTDGATNRSPSCRHPTPRQKRQLHRCSMVCIPEPSPSRIFRRSISKRAEERIANEVERQRMLDPRGRKEKRTNPRLLPPRAPPARPTPELPTSTPPGPPTPLPSSIQLISDQSGKSSSPRGLHSSKNPSSMAVGNFEPRVALLQ